MIFEPVIGMEIHVELASKAKVFCECDAGFGTEPNTHTCPVCLGLPGTLPVLNPRSLELALRVCIALGCEIPSVSTFDRKNYYYPDLPKNYQISQQYHPFGRNGVLEIPVGDAARGIGIDNVHLEEDAGKNIHPETRDLAGTTLVDLNRAGVTLLEIVSRPDMRSLEELRSYMQTMWSLLRYIEVSDCKIQEGSMRFELNVSVRPEGSEEISKQYVEVKNVGSMTSVLRAAEYEIERQSDLMETGGTIAKETRLWDDNRGETRTMRGKEFAQDYRYFPEPDLVPIEISREWIEEIRSGLPELPLAKRDRFIADHGISAYDAEVLVADRANAEFFEETIRLGAPPKTAANWVTTNIMGVLNERGIEIGQLPITPTHLAETIALIEEGTISTKIAKTVFEEILATGKPPKRIVEEKGLVQISDEGALEAEIEKAIAENPQAAEQFAAGKEKAIGRIVGTVMKATQGKANPQLVQEIIIRKLKGG